LARIDVKVAAFGPVVVGLLLAVLAAGIDEPRRPGLKTVFEIPPGTADRVALGADVADVLPPRITTTVGIELVVSNSDTADHVFGPFLLTPGQSWSQRFALPGDYPMVCSLYPTDFVVHVVPASEPRFSGLLLRAWTLYWGALGAFLVGRLGLELAASTDRDGTHVADTGSARSRLRSLPSSAVLAGVALPGTSVALVALNVVVLSRLSPWEAAITSRGLPHWMATVVTALIVGGLVFYAGEYFSTNAAGAAAAALTFLVLVLGLWPNVGPVALPSALLATGGGLLAVTAIAAIFPRSGVSVEPTSMRRATVLGIAVVVLGLLVATVLKLAAPAMALWSE
jgi:hypothetical protein